jgi:hypothetical protein
VAKQRDHESSAWQPGDDNSARHPSPWRAQPAYMYVHYLEPGRHPVPTYLFQLIDPAGGVTGADVTNAVRAIEAKTVPTVPRQPGMPLEWRALSYAVFVLADREDRFTEAGVTFEVQLPPPEGFKNYTFFDGKFLNEESGCSVFYCKNYRRKVDRRPLGQNTEEYKWTAHHQKRDQRTHTDSGNNTGP